MSAKVDQNLIMSTLKMLICRNEQHNEKSKFDAKNFFCLPVKFVFSPSIYLLTMRIQRIKEQPIIAEEEAYDLSLMDKLISKYRNNKGILIPLLQGTQDIYGFIPSQAFEKLHQETGLPINEMFGVATFYAQFRLKPVGKHIIKVCHGTACHVQNANEITDALQDSLEIKDGETTADRFYTLESVACLGCCSLAPVMMVDEETYGKLTGAEAVKIIKNLKIKEKSAK